MESSDNDLQLARSDGEQGSTSDESACLHEASVTNRAFLGQIQSVLLLKKRYQLYAQVMNLYLTVFDDDDVEDGDFSVNPTMPKKEVLRDLLLGHRSQFKHVTGFFPEEWEELCRAVIPTITAHSRSTGALKIKPGRPPKLNPDERILSCVMLLKYVSNNNLFWQSPPIQFEKGLNKSKRGIAVELVPRFSF